MDNELFDVNIALTHLKNKEIIVSNKTFFALKDKVVIVFNQNSNYHISIDDFLNLFKDNKFALYDDNNFNVDYEKDNEYYNQFKHK